MTFSVIQALAGLYKCHLIIIHTRTKDEVGNVYVIGYILFAQIQSCSDFINFTNSQRQNKRTIFITVAVPQHQPDIRSVLLHES